MAEFFINKYVIEIKSQRGITEYNFIASPADWRRVTGALTGSLSAIELNSQSLPPSAQKRSANAFSEYATFSREKTSRVTFEIRIAEHPDWQKAKSPFGEKLLINVLLLFLLVLTLMFLFAAFAGLVFVIRILLTLVRH